MNFFIIDRSKEVRKIIGNIVKSNNLGIVAEIIDDESEFYIDYLLKKKIDILVIDQNFSNRSGLDIVREIAPYYNGKIVMLVEDGDVEYITDSYSSGVDFCIRKPIVEMELSCLLQKLRKQIVLENALEEFGKKLNLINSEKSKKHVTSLSPYAKDSIVQIGKTVLMELGIIGDPGNKDLLDILYLLHQSEKNGKCGTPSLKNIYEDVIRLRFTAQRLELTDAVLKKEVESSKQRIRRVIHNALDHVASLGLTDYTNPKFEDLAIGFFDYNQVRKRMLEIEGKEKNGQSYQQVNIRKFILALYLTTKQKRNEIKSRNSRY